MSEKKTYVIRGPINVEPCQLDYALLIQLTKACELYLHLLNEESTLLRTHLHEHRPRMVLPKTSQIDMTIQSSLSNSRETYFYAIYHILIELGYYTKTAIAPKQEKVEWDFFSQNTE